MIRADATDLFALRVVEIDPARHVVMLRGELDMIGSERAWPKLDALLVPGALLVLDVSHIDLADTGGLRMLLLAQRQATERGATLRLLGARPWLRNHLRTGGVLHLFELHQDLATALTIDGTQAPRKQVPTRASRAASA